MSDDRKDLPPVGASNFLERLRETVSVYLGTRGDLLDRGVTVRDLVDAGIVSLRAGASRISPIAGVGPSISAAAGPPGPEGPAGPPGSDAVYEEDLTPPPTPTNFTATAGITNIIVECDPQLYSAGHGHLSSVLYGATWVSGPLPTFGSAVEIAQFPGTVFAYPTTTGTTWHLWLKWQTVDGVLSTSPAGGTNGVVATTGKIGNVNLGPLIIESGNLASGAVTATKLADLSVGAGKFASGIEPVTIVGSVPGTLSTRSIFNTADGKLYRWSGSAYVASVPTADLTGQVSDAQIAGMAASKVTGTLTNAQIADLAATKITGTLVSTQIADAAITTAKFAAGIAPVEIVGTLPVSGNYQGRTAFLTTDNKLYRHTGSAWVSAVPATDITGTVADAQIAAIAASKVTGTLTNAQIADLAATKITGQLVSTQIADAAITTAKFASGIAPVEIVATLPATGNYQGRTAFLTTDNKLYRHTGSAWVSAVPSTDITGTLTNAQIADLAATKITGQITTTQITNDAVTSAKVAAGAIVAGKIAAGTIVAADIAASTITGSNIAAGTITASNIATDTITAGQIAAGAIGASEVAAGAITTAKLLVTGRGAALNADPGMLDSSAWAGGAYTLQTVADPYSGRNTLRGTSGVTIYSDSFHVDIGKKYRVRAVARKDATATGGFYLRMLFADATGATIAIYNVANVENQTLTTSWAVFESSAFSPLSNAVTARVAVVLNWNTATGYHEVQDVRAEQVIDASLIVDGAVTTNKLLANAVTAAKIAANTITASQIAAGTITATEIAGATITGAKIAAGTIAASNIVSGTITATQIAGSTITGAQIAAGTITASNIAADTITAGQIAAGAISASEVAAGAITTSKLLVVPESLCPDPVFRDYAWWAGASTDAFGWYPEDYNAGGGGALVLGVPRCVTLWSGHPTNNPGTARRHLWSNSVSITAAGQKLRLRAKFNNTSNQWFNVTARFYASDGTFADITVQSTAGSGVSTLTAQGTVPPFANVVQFIIYNESGTTLSGYTSVSMVSLDLAAGADLIVDGAITTDKLLANAVTAAKIASNTITASQIAAGTITATEIAGATITGAKIAAGTIAASNITAGTITGNEIAANSVNADRLVANSITAGKIQAGAITGTEIAASTITTGKLVLADTNNLIPNPDFNTGNTSGWNRITLTGGGTITVIPASTGGVPASASTINVLRFTHTGGGETSITAGDGNFNAAGLPGGVPITVGETYTLLVEAGGTAGTGLVLELVTKTAAGTIAVPGSVGPTLTSSWATYSVTFTSAVSGKLYARLGFYAGGTHTSYVTNVRLFKRASADLIVDGAITANKLAANALAVGTAAIQNGAIVNAMIGSLAVDDAKIAAMSVSKLTAGSLAVGQYAQSTSYTAGSGATPGTGWRLSGNGDLEVSNALVRGTVYSTAGQIGGNTIDSTGMQSAGYTAGSTGWRFDTSGLIKAYSGAGANVLDMSATGTSPVLKVGTKLSILADGTATFGGDISAATGTFAGGLNITPGGTGARIEIKTNVIKVFDAGNVLRVRLGDLTA